MLPRGSGSAFKNKGAARVERLERRLALSTTVLAGHGDAQNTGQQLNETVLNAGNVGPATFGKLFTVQVDGAVYAQPLTIPAVQINSGSASSVHNTVFVATEHGGVYALDADSGAILWQQSVINPAAGITPVTQADDPVLNIAPESCITGSPVIDPATGTLYLEAETRNVINGQVHILQTLHAFDIHSGVEVDGGPMVIADAVANANETAFTPVSGPSVGGSGAASVNGVLTFNAYLEFQRPGLAISNGSVYVAFGSNADTGPYHGWVLGFNKSTLALDAVFCDTPNAVGGGLWQAGGDIAVDPATGDLFISVGNGAFDVQLNGQGFPALGDYGDAVVKLVPDATTAANPGPNGWGISVQDYFAPFNQAELNARDFDVGSSGPLLLSDAAGSAAHQHLLLAGGKEGRLYLIDRDNMGKFDPQNDHVVQEVVNADNGQVDQEAYYDGRVYVVGSYGDVARAYSVANAQLSTGPSSTSSNAYQFPGSSPTVSSDSATDPAAAVVWTTDTGAGELRAYSVDNLADELFSSSEAPAGRDRLGAPPSKFAAVTVADGHVWTPSTGKLLTVYGLLPPNTTLPKLPAGLTVQPGSRGQLVLAWSNTAVNQGGILVQESTDGGATFSPLANLPGYPNEFTVSGLSDATSYTFEIEAYNNIGVSGWTAPASGVTPPAPQGSAIDFSSGFAQAQSAVTLNGSAALTGGDLLLTTGANQAGSALLNSPVQAARFFTSFDFTLNPDSQGGMAFVISGGGPTSLGSGGAGLGYAGLPSSAAVYFEAADAGEDLASFTGLLVNGAAVSSANQVSLDDDGIDLTSGHQFHVTLQYDGATLSETIRDLSANVSEAYTFPLQLPAAIATGNASVGFCASTTTDAAQQAVEAWTYVPYDPPPASLAATPLSATSIALNWREMSTNQSGFNIQVSSDGTNFQSIAQALPQARSFVVGDLQPDVSYTFRVSAMHAPGDSDFSNLATAATLAGTGPGLLDYTTGFAAAGGALTFNGSAALVNNTLEVIGGLPQQVGSVFSNAAVDASQFQTSFTFQFPVRGANGLTFTLQDDGPTAIGRGTTGLAYLSIPNSVCLKFDLDADAGQTPSATGLYINGQSPTTNSIDTRPSGINFHSLHDFHVILAYQSGLLTETIEDLQTSATFTDSFTINIPAILGANQAFVGFTASDGGAVCLPTIFNWRFVSTPPAPVGLTATPVSSSEIDLAWNENATSQTQFTIERSTDDVSFSPIATVGDVRSYADQSFSGGTTYYYQVMALNAVSSSVGSNIVSAVSPTPPATPSNPTVTLISTTEIDLAWTNHATNATSVQIFRKDGVSGALNLVATLSPTAQAYDDTGLSPGTSHDYHIEAVNISGHNDFAGILAYTLCDAPTGLTATGGVGKISLQWDPTPGAQSYIIYRGYSTGLESNQPLFTGVTSSSYTDVGVPPGTVYFYHVVAVDPGGQSDNSTEVSAQASAAPALQVVSVTPLNGGTLAGKGVITAAFNEDLGIDTTLNASTFTLIAAGQTLPTPANVSYNPATHTATLTPRTSLTPGARYTATLSAAISDQNGNYLYGGYAWSFVYLAPVSLTGPASASVRANHVLLLGGSSRLVVNDPNAGSAIQRLTLTCTRGALDFASLKGAKIVYGKLKSEAITLTGTVSALNAALSQLRYIPRAHYTGSAIVYAFYQDQALTTQPMKVSRIIHLIVTP